MSDMPQRTGEHAPHLISRRAFLAGSAAVLVVGGGLTLRHLANESVIPTDARPTTLPDVDVEATITEATDPAVESSSTSDSTTTTEQESEPAQPELPSFTMFEDGQFLGVARIDYIDTPDRPTADIHAYYQRKGLAVPPMNNPLLHQLIAGGDEAAATHETITDEMLAHGVVAHKIDGVVRILAMHNVTPIEAPIEINGETHNQTHVGINAVVVPGDTLTLTLPDQNGGLADFVFTAVRSWIVDIKDTAATQAMLDDAEPVGEPKVRTYKCWPPGSDRYRLVDEWVQTDATTSDTRVAQGNGGVVGVVGPNL